MRPDERRRARPAVQVLVAATHGEIGGIVRIAAAVQVDRHGAGRVRQVPDDQRARGMRGAIDRGHPVHAAIAIVDVREQQHRHPSVELRENRVGIHAPQLARRARARWTRRCRGRSGNCSRSVRMTLRSGAATRIRSSAALRALNRFTDVASATTSSPAPAPTSRAILSPTRCGMSIQPALFQLRISPRPHSSSTTRRTRAAASWATRPASSRRGR